MVGPLRFYPPYTSGLVVHASEVFLFISMHKLFLTFGMKKEGKCSRFWDFNMSMIKLLLRFSPLKGTKKLLKDDGHLELINLYIKLFVWIVNKSSSFKISYFLNKVVRKWNFFSCSVSGSCNTLLWSGKFFFHKKLGHCT